MEKAASDLQPGRPISIPLGQTMAQAAKVLETDMSEDEEEDMEPMIRSQINLQSKSTINTTLVPD